MPYHLHGSFDGACRHNGTITAYGGCGIYFPRLRSYCAAKPLFSSPSSPVTSQVAELNGLIMILEAGLRKKRELDERDPFLYFM
jgi:ribonuclease HI